MLRAPAWIGVNRSGDGSFVTPSGAELTFTDWAPGQPNGPNNQNCVNINWESDGNGGWAWGDLQCTFEMPCAVCRV